MVTDREASARSYTDGQVVAWLSWLARRMRRYGQTVFMIEHMQPEWLATRGQRTAYRALFALCFGFLIGGVLHAAWLMGDYLDPPCPGSTRIPLWLWWVSTSIWVFAMEGIAAQRFEWLSRSGTETRTRAVAETTVQFSMFFASWFAMWLIIRAIGGDGYAEWAGIGPAAVGCTESPPTALSLGKPLMSAAYVALVYGARVSGRQGVATVEALGWSWRSSSRGVLLGAAAGMAVWALYVASLLADGPTFSAAVAKLYLFPPLGAAGGFLFGGLAIRVVREKTVPNEGMRLSIRNAALAAALCGPVLGLIAWPVLIQTLGQPATAGPVSLALGAAWFGAIATVIAALWFGGMDVLMHYTLRVVLAVSGQAPANIARFLNYASDELDFVRRVGGGYVFIHRHLLEHFASRKE